MSFLQAYLERTETKKILSQKPGEEGFSLIELVVVVAVLAILAAIAIPSFVSINDKAKASAAMNTLAQIAKECAVKDANNVQNPTFAVPNLSGYANYTPTGRSCSGVSATNPTINFISDTAAKYPNYTYNVDTGAKTCTHGASGALHGCSDPTNGFW